MRGALHYGGLFALLVFASACAGVVAMPTRAQVFETVEAAAHAGLRDVLRFHGRHVESAIGVFRTAGGYGWRLLAQGYGDESVTFKLSRDLVAYGHTHTDRRYPECSKDDREAAARAAPRRSFMLNAAARDRLRECLPV